jgi:glycosyltransferase involved in cell wall biosynthesis
MKIAFVTSGDGANIHAWSGIPFHMIQAFKAASHEVVLIRNLVPRTGFVLSWTSRFRRKVLKQNYTHLRNASILRDYAKQISAQLETIKPDIVFSPGTLPVAYLKTSIPVVTWTDATYANLVNYYPEYTGLPDDCVRDGNAAEQSALDHGTLALYGSEWAAQSALNDYHADPAKVHVVPFGANLSEATTAEEVLRRIEARPTDRCRLTFLGIDWERKGGPIALAVARELNQRGLPTELDIVGTTPPQETEIPSYVRAHGFISKKEPEGAKKIEDLLLNSHFLILPTRAECFGIVFAEASSLGTPSLAAKTGGTPTAIHEGVSGFLVPISSTEEEVSQYCEIILGLMRDPAAYRALALSSLKEYQTRLNWISAGATASRLMEDLLVRSRKK